MVRILYCCFLEDIVAESLFRQHSAALGSTYADVEKEVVALVTAK